MKNITVIYRPLPSLALERKLFLLVPNHWRELTVDQLIAIISLYKEQISELGFLSKMTGIPAKILSKLSEFERFELLDLFEFISDVKPYHQFIIRKIKPGYWKSSLFAPKEKLKGITFGQFIFADTYFLNYQTSKDETDLNKFIASLYLLKNEKFSETIINERYAQIAKLDWKIREAIALNFQLIHEWLSLAYPLIFQKHEELISKDPLPEPVQGKHDPNQWIKVFQNFVGDDILHDDIWAEKPINTIFAFMTRKYKENARTRK